MSLMYWLNGLLALFLRDLVRVSSDALRSPAQERGGEPVVNVLALNLDLDKQQ
jgi:hypothetical protein